VGHSQVRIQRGSGTTAVGTHVLTVIDWDDRREAQPLVRSENSWRGKEVSPFSQCREGLGLIRMSLSPHPGTPRPGEGCLCPPGTQPLFVHVPEFSSQILRIGSQSISSSSCKLDQYHDVEALFHTRGICHKNIFHYWVTRIGPIQQAHPPAPRKVQPAILDSQQGSVLLRPEDEKTDQEQARLFLAFTTSLSSGKLLEYHQDASLSACSTEWNPLNDNGPSHRIILLKVAFRRPNCVFRHSPL
jgi:hypothetical protein